jgi:hypothetical protein
MLFCSATAAAGLLDSWLGLQQQQQQQQLSVPAMSQLLRAEMAFVEHVGGQHEQ